MPEEPFLAEFPADWEETRATLHAYARAVGAMTRVHAEPHPKWWHVSLSVTDEGLESNPVALPGGEGLTLVLDLRNHQLVARTDGGDVHKLSVAAGLTGTEMGDRLIAIASSYGLEGAYPRDRFENDDPRRYDTVSAERFHGILRNVAAVFEHHRASLEGDVSPVQLWTHGFDLAVEWFGSRVERYEEDGEVTEYPSQLNLGFYPGGRAYFYSNPWPFESERLLDNELPHGAEWHTDGWEGTILYYDLLEGDPDAEKKLLEYARAVHEIAAPTLTA